MHYCQPRNHRLHEQRLEELRRQQAELTRRIDYLTYFAILRLLIGQAHT